MPGRSFLSDNSNYIDSLRLQQASVAHISGCTMLRQANVSSGFVTRFRAPLSGYSDKTYPCGSWRPQPRTNSTLPVDIVRNSGRCYPFRINLSVTTDELSLLDWMRPEVLVAFTMLQLPIVYYYNTSK
jgi:hypothetical protein